jgi:general secretion pathway protein M
LASIEIVPADAVGAFRRIGLKLSLSVSWPVLVALLQSVESGTPPILIDDIGLHASPMPVDTGPQLLDASFTVYAFRATTPQDGPS